MLFLIGDLIGLISELTLLWTNRPAAATSLPVAARRINLCPSVGSKLTCYGEKPKLKKISLKIAIFNAPDAGG
jgi:hypothetical protein